MAGEDCAVCKIIRTYLLFAVPLLALVGLSTTDSDSERQLWFARAELIDILAWGALLALCLITLYRAYQEYYLPSRRIRDFEKLRSQLMSSEVEENSKDSKTSEAAE